MSVSTFRPRNKQYNVGDYIILKNREGYIRYIGKREFHHGCWYGIELTRGQGPNDGSEHGKRYFCCKERRGIFIRLYAIKKKLSPSEIPHNIHKKITPKVNGPLPLLPQSKTLSESRSHRSMSSDSSLSNTPSPNVHKSDYNIKLDTHRSLSNKYNKHTKKSPKNNNRNIWHTHRNNNGVRRPKSARVSTNSSKNSHKSQIYHRYNNNNNNNVRSPSGTSRSGNGTGNGNKSPSFVLTSPRTPRQSPRKLKRSLTPRIQTTNSYTFGNRRNDRNDDNIIDIDEPDTSDVTSDTSDSTDDKGIIRGGARLKLSLERDRHYYSNTPRKNKDEKFRFDENQLHVMNMSRSSSVNTPRTPKNRNNNSNHKKKKKSRRNKSKNSTKDKPKIKIKKTRERKKHKSKKKTKKIEKIHDRTPTDIDGMKNIFNNNNTENNSTYVKGHNNGYNKHRNKSKKSKNKCKIIRPKLELKRETNSNRIKKYNKRESFHRRKSRTVDFDMNTHTQSQLKELRDIMEQNKSEFDDSSSDDDDDPPPKIKIKRKRKVNNNGIPPLKSPKDKGKYTFRLHIKNNKMENMGVNNGKKEYNLILPNKEPIPLKLKNSYGLGNVNKKKNGHGTNLSLAVNDMDEDDGKYESNNVSGGSSNNRKNRKRTSTMSSSSNVAHQYIINNEEDKSHSSQVESNKLTLLNKNKKLKDWELDLLPDTPESDNIFDNNDDILFISQNSMKNIHKNNTTDTDISSNSNGGLGIDESVIEYHVPSMTNKQKNKNKNIKINICINNDINTKNKPNTKAILPTNHTALTPTKKHHTHGHENRHKHRQIYHQKVNSTHSLATHLIHSPSHSPRHSPHTPSHHISPSISSSQTFSLKKKTKKKKLKSKHKHSHRHKSKRHGHKSKKNCSCHKHREKEKEKEKTIYIHRKKDKKNQKNRKDKKSKQIKFRSKIPKKSVTPKNAMPPPPISPRNGYNNMQTYDWSGLI